ncbi:hypothetical protein INT82_01765 [Mannheimia haemolytica]|nr:hypothetical protein [Mannheimia haemolytica]
MLFSLMSHLNRMFIRFPKADVLRVTGGPVKSKVWMQMLADLTGMRLENTTNGRNRLLGCGINGNARGWAGYKPSSSLNNEMRCLSQIRKIMRLIRRNISVTKN